MLGHVGGVSNFRRPSEARFGFDGEISSSNVADDNCSCSKTNRFGCGDVTHNFSFDEKGFYGDRGFDDRLALNSKRTIRFDFAFNSPVENEPVFKAKASLDSYVVRELIGSSVRGRNFSFGGSRGGSCCCDGLGLSEWAAFGATAACLGAAAFLGEGSFIAAGVGPDDGLDAGLLAMGSAHWLWLRSDWRWFRSFFS